MSDLHFDGFLFLLSFNFGGFLRYSVGKPASTQMRELKPGDFDPREKYWTRFPPEGSKITPSHQSVEFRWKDYCPMVFRYGQLLVVLISGFECLCYFWY